MLSILIGNISMISSAMGGKINQMDSDLSGCQNYGYQP
jgi:hypothetical protein